MSKTKILMITRNLPPLIGGMERLNWHIADELSKQHQLHLISHSKAKALAPQHAKFSSTPLNPLALFLLSSFIQAFWQCLVNRPTVILAGSGLTAPIVVILAKLFRIRSLVYIHGLDIATNHPLYNLLWLPMIRQADQVIANSSATYQVCIQKRVSKDRLTIIHPGVSYPPLDKNPALIAQLKQHYQLHDKKILISVGRLTNRKGLNEFVDLCLPKIIQQHPNTVLVIIGDTPNQALHKGLQSQALIRATAEKHGLSHHVIFFGNTNDDQRLSSMYYLSDLHIFPVKHIPEDLEGFGMVAIEAAAHGTASVAFATGGIVDAIADTQSGYLIPANDYERLTEKVIELLAQPAQINSTDCKNFASGFGWDKLLNKFNLLLKNR